MSRTQETRLARLEKRDLPQVHLIIWRKICEMDGSIGHPNTYRTWDGKHEWRREPHESGEDFERRVMDDTERLAVRGPVALRPGLG